MAENVKLAENVILVDVAYFNDVVKDLKRYFELQLGRSPRGLEGQHFVWTRYDRARELPFLAANRELLANLSLPCQDQAGDRVQELSPQGVGIHAGNNLR